MKLGEFKVGDKVRGVDWPDGMHAEIMYIGEHMSLLKRYNPVVDEEYEHAAYNDGDGYHHYKQHKRIWLWATKTGKVTDAMYSTPPGLFTIKLLWSETELPGTGSESI